MTDYRTLTLERAGDVATLTLDRPDVLNALSLELLGELLEALRELSSSDARVLILTGRGRAFSSGADLSSIAVDADLADPGSVRVLMDKWRDAILAIRGLPIPSIAAVAGPAYGGGCNLALACDLVVAAESARFCESYVDRGVTTDLGGSYILPRIVGVGRARQLLLTGEVIDGRRAEQIGLASEVVVDEDLEARTMELAATLASKDPTVLRKMRSLIDAGLDGSLAEALDREGEQVASLLGSPVFQRRLESFLSQK